MSLGFSVGDIILLSQLSYSLYGTLKSGRHNASRDLKELEDVLFGLRCALDHLRNVACDISKAASASASSDSYGREMQQALHQMIHNCSITLEDLHNATKKYRDGALVTLIPADARIDAVPEECDRLQLAKDPLGHG
ncbi:hypothetical protein AYL99_01980 [Fonsecaea erecta]|uniref:Fungal N-terminal domain-containing protein n=1 Tax=Fonsecaea erecta TaxID=1367422 RepID=A0A178ZU62_9EURO|nr:hypothetical protein AYL99_01980 [Fonsecaea erecta]OAP62753.1 hypothetical protein AYL99_01980 [Fonsecaea erecta]